MLVCRDNLSQRNCGIYRPMDKALKYPINAVVSMGRRNTQLEPTLH